MKFQNIIFYFGESKEVSNMKLTLKKALPHTELKSITKLLEEEQLSFSNYEKVGFIVPLEKWGVPKEVEEFLTKVSLKNINYTFAIITDSLFRGKAIAQIDELLIYNGLYLNYGRYVNEQNIHFTIDKVMERLIRMDDHLESEGIIYKIMNCSKEIFKSIVSLFKKKLVKTSSSVNNVQQ